MQKSGAARATRARTAVVIATHSIRAEALSIAAGAGVPLIVLEGRTGHDAPLDLPLLMWALGGNISDSSISRLDETVLIL